jgi:hypothetical protein
MRIDSGTIIKGTLLFLVMYAINVAFVWFVSSDYLSWVVGTPDLPPPGLNDPKSIPAPGLSAAVGSIEGLLGALVWFVPGYHAGRSLKAMGLAHGALIGALGYSVAFVVMSALPELGFQDTRDIFRFLYGAVAIALVCSLAGGVGELHGSKRA